MFFIVLLIVVGDLVWFHKGEMEAFLQEKGKEKKEEVVIVIICILIQSFIYPPTIGRRCLRAKEGTSRK